MADPPASPIATNTANCAFVSQPDSALLNMAAELRNAVYELVLVSDEPICVSDPTDKRAKDQVALLYTCRQVRAEATAIYYSNNTFYGSIGRAPLRRTDESIIATCVFMWLKNISPLNRGLISRLELGWADRDALCQLLQTYDGSPDSWSSLIERPISDIAACHVAMLKELELSWVVVVVTGEPWTKVGEWREELLEWREKIAHCLWATRMMDLMTPVQEINALISEFEALVAKIGALNV